MSNFADLATELILKISSYISCDHYDPTILHLAMVNKRVFAIVMPQVIEAQSLLVEVLQFMGHFDYDIRERDALKEASYTSYWFHPDCHDNLFADMYNRLSLGAGRGRSKHVFQHLLALVRRAPSINKIVLEFSWSDSFDYEQMGNFLEICAHKSPPPELAIHASHGSNVFEGDPWNGPFLEPEFVRDHAPADGVVDGATQMTTDIAPRHGRQIPRQPPRNSTEPCPGSSCIKPTLSITVAANPTLTKLFIDTQNIFTPSLYPYTIALLNLAPLTLLSISDIQMSPKAWSQILYALSIPTLKTFALSHSTVHFLDVFFFLERHPSISCLQLIQIDLLPADRSEPTELPYDLVLPSLVDLRCVDEYATIFFKGRLEHRLPLLKNLTIVPSLTRSQDNTTDLSSVYDTIATNPAKLEEIGFLGLGFEESGFVQWALRQKVAITGIKSICIHQRTELDDELMARLKAWCGQKTDITLEPWVDGDGDDWEMTLCLMLDFLLFTTFPDLQMWRDIEMQHNRADSLVLGYLMNSAADSIA